MGLIGRLNVNAASEPPGFLIGEPWCVVNRTMAKSNGTTNFGKVRAGTPMGEVTATKAVRPCASSISTNTGAGATAVITMASTGNLFVGDTVGVAGTTTGETVQTVDSATQITLTGNATWTAGDEIHAMDGSKDAIGLMMYDTTTYDAAVDGDGAVVHSEKGVYILRGGCVSEAGIEAGTIELESTHKADMPNIIVEP